MTLFKRSGITWTRFKVNIKEKMYWFTYLYIKYGIDIKKPVRHNSRFIYFEKEGDLING